ncbi:hypothetical protein SAMN05421812_12048 [Asanoa hainanensis]|uniref:LAGLIDADG endonuclease n=1 Tax=Asanoa hainanensis TaxID=560556 RepID=A0A239PDJ0_9ACTN|nr:LAGLIDADG family homing endonuclease [Asanoa hainanensis]SNT65121.1 hypothetical protein SAMN05421812_12048 [Asanoa hainanensis]
MPSEVEKAWVAGILDGDGCVTLHGYAASKAYRKPLIVVDSTDIEILQELSRLYGGGLVVKKKAKDHHLQAWTWRLYGSDKVLALIADVLPYMRCAVKVDRATLLANEYKHVTRRNGYYTPDARARKEAFEARFMAIGAGRGSQRRRAFAEEGGVEPPQV